MGFGRGFTFVLGSLCGVYVAQNYRVPRICEWIHSGCVKARELEKAYRRPENFSPNEGGPAHDCRFRARDHERTYHRPENFSPNEDGPAHYCWFGARDHERIYHRPENFYGDEAGEEHKNKE
ncbi:hypothetical protein A4A49_00679 [Nicotiana attenuata]|uniref:Uncharacterized protein n=1 Tax=Nicotiana attenuata TaxID=49451 RepID=A0A1J6IRZ9_NICAT|nr:hypothetical protein A4A49_00679 [Nicotiana attenuata]